MAHAQAVPKHSRAHRWIRQESNPLFLFVKNSVLPYRQRAHGTHHTNSLTNSPLKLSKNKNSPREGAIFVTNRIRSAISAGHCFAYYCRLCKIKVKNVLMIF
jgi:hypothetical protein